MELLNRLRSLTEEKLKNTKEEKYQIILEMLEDESCFFRISSSTSLAILNDLGFTDEESLAMYEELISPKSYVDITEKLIVK